MLDESSTSCVNVRQWSFRRGRNIQVSVPFHVLIRNNQFFAPISERKRAVLSRHPLKLCSASKLLSVLGRVDHIVIFIMLHTFIFLACVVEFVARQGHPTHLPQPILIPTSGYCTLFFRARPQDCATRLHTVRDRCPPHAHPDNGYQGDRVQDWRWPL